MIDIKEIRENPSLYIQAAKNKRIVADIEKLVDIDRRLMEAKARLQDIDYISTHGTSTQENDFIETLAIKTVFGDRAKQIPVSSVKSMMGHLIGAAGAAELITCILALRDGVVPPTINLDDPDPKLDLDYVPHKSRKLPVRTIMKESFGFGGQNNVVIVKKFEV